MRRLLIVLLMLSTGIFGFPADIKPETSIVASSHGKPLRIRMLILKHSREYIADHDAKLALDAIDNSARKGLDIRCIGNHFFTDPVNGVVAADEFTTILMIPDDKVRYERFKDFVSEKIKIDAKRGDTVIIYTIGHGGADGGLHNIGQRVDVMKALAEAAEENHQHVVWWQLSCHASAKLPNLSTLTPSQQKYLTIVASSNAAEESIVDLQGKIMDKLFAAMIGKSDLDTNGDGLISAAELDAFLRKPGMPRQGGGPIVYGLHPDSIFFGDKGLDIPIIDRIGQQGQYPDDYIPIPE